MGDSRPEPLLLRRFLGDRRFALTLPRAVSLQILHPAIAAGLVQHSPNLLWYHKKRAVSQMIYLTYRGGDMRFPIQYAHEHVKGIDDRGARYHAMNPSVFFFQHATYVDTLVASINTFHGPMSDRDHERLYAECCEWYLRYGVSARWMPATWPEFVDYFEEACASQLRMNSYGRQLVPQVLRPNAWIPAQLPSFAVRALLGPRARELFAIEDRRADRIALRAYAATVRSGAAVATPRMRYLRPARVAAR